MISEKIFFGYLAVMSLVTFLAYGDDKARAKANRWRIPEKVLIGLSLMGGFIGGYLGMKVFRHKTRHWYFYAVQIAGAVLWAAGFAVLHL